MRSTSFQENLTCKVTTWIMQERWVTQLLDWASAFFSFRDPYGSWHLIHNPLISTLADIVYSGPMIGRKRVKQLQLTSFTFDFCITRFFEQLCMTKRWANGFRVSWALLGMKYTQVKLSVPCCLDGHKCPPHSKRSYILRSFSRKVFYRDHPLMWMNPNSSKFVRFFLTWRFFAVRVAGLSQCFIA